GSGEAQCCGGLYPWWHWLLERENPRTLQVCT
ncbi:hypothetical protein AZ040_002067, partial [Escherichia coli]